MEDDFFFWREKLPFFIFFSWIFMSEMVLEIQFTLMLTHHTDSVTISLIFSKKKYSAKTLSIAFLPHSRKTTHKKRWDAKSMNLCRFQHWIAIQHKQCHVYRARWLFTRNISIAIHINACALCYDKSNKNSWILDVMFVHFTQTTCSRKHTSWQSTLIRHGNLFGEINILPIKCQWISLSLV